MACLVPNKGSVRGVINEVKKEALRTWFATYSSTTPRFSSRLTSLPRRSPGLGDARGSSCTSSGDRELEGSGRGDVDGDGAAELDGETSYAGGGTSSVPPREAKCAGAGCTSAGCAGSDPSSGRRASSSPFAGRVYMLSIACCCAYTLCSRKPPDGAGCGAGTA